MCYEEKGEANVWSVCTSRLELCLGHGRMSEAFRCIVTSTKSSGLGWMFSNIEWLHRPFPNVGHSRKDDSFFRLLIDINERWLGDLVSVQKTALNRWLTYSERFKPWTSFQRQTQDSYGEARQRQTGGMGYKCIACDPPCSLGASVGVQPCDRARPRRYAEVEQEVHSTNVVSSSIVSPLSVAASHL